MFFCFFPSELGDIAIPPRLTQFLAEGNLCRRKRDIGIAVKTNRIIAKDCKENHITTEENHWSLDWSDYGRSGLNLAVFAFLPARWRTNRFCVGDSGLRRLSRSSSYVLFDSTAFGVRKVPDRQTDETHTWALREAISSLRNMALEEVDLFLNSTNPSATLSYDEKPLRHDVLQQRDEWHAGSNAWQ
ncbi:Uncharacterized protein APZ42_017241 [Daphnia magna]|uniref:Uncharacterized protein n=1 Tax=Daphnia magna TaxID=35525 RepID=A0A162CJQ4_9CRUS|nr:Uncharacterized protein APZ42_017241 [Daphnia magna]